MPARVLPQLLTATLAVAFFLSLQATAFPAEPSDPTNATIRIKHGETSFRVRFYCLSQAGGIDRYGVINPYAPTVFIIHGFMDTAITHEDGVQPAAWMQKVAAAVRTGKAVEKGAAANIVLVDWSEGAGDNLASYFRIIGHVQPVGDAIAAYMNDAGLQPSQTMLIGHSLGGHIAGAAGTRLQLQHEGAKLQAILAIDEAGPGFESGKPTRMLDASDAERVLSLKTSIWCGRKKHCATTSLFINPVRNAAGKLLGYDHPGNAPTYLDFRKLNLTADRKSHLYGREVLAPALLRNESLRATQQPLCYQSLLNQKPGIYDIVTTDPM